MMFIRGLGGFNYPGKGFIKPMPETPKRNPDYQLLGETYASQAFVYRLCNPYDLFHRQALLRLKIFRGLSFMVHQHIFRLGIIWDSWSSIRATSIRE